MRPVRPLESSRRERLWAWLVALSIAGCLNPRPDDLPQSAASDPTSGGSSRNAGAAADDADRGPLLQEPEVAPSPRPGDSANFSGAAKPEPSGPGGESLDEEGGDLDAGVPPADAAPADAGGDTN